MQGPEWNVLTLSESLTCILLSRGTCLFVFIFCLHNYVLHLPMA